MIRALARRTYSLGDTLGLSAAFRNSSWRRERLLVLCWHGISLRDEHLWCPGLFISPKVFRERLTALAEGGYTVLPLEEALTLLWAKDLPPCSVAITFDDGFYDFFHHAVPILSEFGFPATLYLTTYYVDYPRPLFNLMTSYLLWRSIGPNRRLPDGSPVSTEAEAAAAQKRILNQAESQNATGAEKDAIATALAHDLGMDYEALLKTRLLQLVTPDEVRQMAQSKLLSIEAHTHRHRTPTDLQAFTKELRDNQDRIEQMTGRRPVHFCYPSGVYRHEYFPVFEREGFKSATSCEARLASPADPHFLVPRFLDHSGVTQGQFRSWLTGIRAFGRGA